MQLVGGEEEKEKRQVMMMLNGRNDFGRQKSGKVRDGSRLNQTTDWLTLQATGFVSSFSPPSLPVA